MADWYVDFSAANNGDGTDGAQAGAPAGVGAWNQFTAGELSSVSPGDVVWFRRTATGSKKAITVGNGTLLGGRIEYNGWPVSSSDEHYAQAQATANTVKATWDADPDSWCIASPVGSTPSYQYVTVRRIHFEETGAGTNLAFDVNSGTPGEFRFYECRASRTGASCPTLRTGTSAFGRLEWDRVDVLGTTPGLISTIGADGASAYVRVRITMTDGGSSVYDVWPSFTNMKSWYLEILDWNDSGTHYLQFRENIGMSDGSWTFTTDDDNVGPLPFRTLFNTGFTFAGNRITIRNLTYNHALSTIPVVGLFTPPPACRVYLENFEFHPSAHTWQVQYSSEDGQLIGRNILSFDPSKINETNEITSLKDAASTFIHFSQINGTEAWYRRMHGVIMQLSTVNRSGGAGNAILVEPQDRPVALQQRGYHNGIMFTEQKGLEAFAFVRTGLGYPVGQTLTAYFAVVHWDGLEDEQRIWFEVELYKNAAAGDFTRKLIDSRKLPKSQSFIADGSTWNNLAGYTAYRAEIPVTLVKDDIVKVRFFVRDTHLDTGLVRNIVAFDPAMTLA